MSFYSFHLNCKLTGYSQYVNLSPAIAVLSQINSSVFMARKRETEKLILHLVEILGHSHYRKKTKVLCLIYTKWKNSSRRAGKEALC